MEVQPEFISLLLHCVNFCSWDWCCMHLLSGNHGVFFFFKHWIPQGFLSHEVGSQSVKTPLKNCKKQCKGGWVFAVWNRTCCQEVRWEVPENSECHSPHLQYCGSRVHQYRMAIHKHLYLVAGCCCSCTSWRTWKKENKNNFHLLLDANHQTPHSWF